MLFNSIDFLIFFPIVVLLYYCIPHRFRYIWLLVSSYYFYMCWNVEYSLLLLASTGITYICGLVVDFFQTHKKSKGKLYSKLAVICSLTLNLSLLVFFKYFTFVASNLQKVLSLINIEISIPEWSFLLPVGISFYIFQALGYIIDVYRGEMKAERNFLRYAVFISFFPQLVAGPIERSKNLLNQFREKHKFCLKNIKENLLLMAWGFFIKMVIADRIAIFVDAVYADYATYNGWYIVIATVLFAFQIYCDFAGYTTIAIGAAGVMGFHLMDNFNSPYCAVSVKDFWSRWHISLTSWFRDYLYIPLGGNRKGVFRKYLNQIIVFSVSGLWHGARWSYVIWGGFNGLFLVIGELISPFKRKIKEKIRWKNEAASNNILQAVITFFLVDFTWMFFRAPGTTDALYMLKSIFTVKNIGVLFDGSLYQLGLDQRNFWLMIICIILLLIVDICHNKGYHIREWIAKQNLWFRWLLYIVLLETILVFGIWGVGYDKSAFIYFQF